MNHIENIDQEKNDSDAFLWLAKMMREKANFSRFAAVEFSFAQAMTMENPREN